MREKCPYLEFFGPYFPAFGNGTIEGHKLINTQAVRRVIFFCIIIF